ncbi:hypothetical protein [Calderihabitans maritimus]|uniref:Uncharacterized protein n=1 Tax=Calderihabitans maritimus TaxID=1246530 RepID=A0A1Z5HSL9_9FIRM|nr:hypothetical protein [Calderihabitans maritimus]GAW92347.1 hypothetical protein KKC1_15020 [Calderihabitans maritimus]
MANSEKKSREAGFLAVKFVSISTPQEAEQALAAVVHIIMEYASGGHKIAENVRKDKVRGEESIL